MEHLGKKIHFTKNEKNYFTELHFVQKSDQMYQISTVPFGNVFLGEGEIASVTVSWKMLSPDGLLFVEKKPSFCFANVLACKQFP